MGMRTTFGRLPGAGMERMMQCVTPWSPGCLAIRPPFLWGQRATRREPSAARERREGKNETRCERAGMGKGSARALGI